MPFHYLHKLIWFVSLVLLQALILNNVHIVGYATPFLYIYLILKFELETSRHALMLWAFCLGLAIDIFSDTPGMNAASLVLVAFVRPPLLRLFVPRDVADNLVPGLHTLGGAAFLKYAACCTLIHHTMLLSLEFFSLEDFSSLLLRVVTSTTLTVVSVLALEGISISRNSST